MNSAGSFSRETITDLVNSYVMHLAIQLRSLYERITASVFQPITEYQAMRF